MLLYPPHNKVVGRVYWFHSIHLSVHLSIRLSICPSRILCPLCRAYSSCWIYVIFIHLIKQLQKVCKVTCKILNLNFWQFFKICNFDFVLFWLGIWCEPLVWIIMGWWGVSQNAGVLVVLVLDCIITALYCIFLSSIKQFMKMGCQTFLPWLMIIWQISYGEYDFTPPKLKFWYGVR